MSKQPKSIRALSECNHGSLVFGASGKYISYAGSNDWALGTGDFCIEWWQYQTQASPPMYSRLFQVGEWSTHSIAVSIESGNFLLWVNNGSAYGPVTLSNYLNQWVHFAVVRQSGVSSVYKNGTRILNVSTPNNVTNSSDQLQIGYGSGNYWNGKITNFRWVKGNSVYDGTQSSITVPTSELPVVTGTKLLLLTNSSGAYLDDSSGLGKIATNNGSVSWEGSSFLCEETITTTTTTTTTTTASPLSQTKIIRSHGHNKLTKNVNHRFWKRPLYRLPKQILNLRLSTTHVGSPVTRILAENRDVISAEDGSPIAAD